jgi:charged multivesicular body protein 6
MGGNQSVPKITPQDRAILEFEWSISLLAFMINMLHSVSNYNEINLDSTKRKQVASVLFYQRVSHSAYWQIQVILDREHTIAKEHLAIGQKDRAVIALRRRKYQQGLLLKTDIQLENLEQLVCVLFR